MDKNNDPTMGGLDALVAAASSVAGHAGRKAAARGVTMEMIDPALHASAPTNDVADAMSMFLSNPAVVQLVAEYNAKNLIKQHRHVSLYTQLLSGSTVPSMAPDTPTQTRSGRISRPPVYPPPNPLQQLFAGHTHTAAVPAPSTLSAPSDTHIQAIKDALENVSSTTDDPANYDALMQAVAGDGSGSSRFWRNTDLANPAWSGLDAPTLAQAAETSQRALGHGLPTNGNAHSARDRGKRAASAMDSTGSESVDGTGRKRQRDDEVEALPEWPLPPTGKGGRKNMPREELLARRRARNRVAAQESRKKKKEFFGNISDRLQDRESAFEQLQSQCRRLEQEVESLKNVILGAGLELPVNLPTATIASLPTPGPSSAVHLPYDTPASFDASPSLDLPFQDLFTIDDNDADDGDFVPPSSPKRDSESDDSDDEDVPSVSVSKSKKGKRSRREDGDNENGNGNEENETPVAIAEDVEEDLFLPIEDVPVPPRDEEDQEKVMKQAMTELHVDTPQELMGVIKKMVETAGYGGVTEEQVGMLSKLLALGQAQGMSVWSATTTTKPIIAVLYYSTYGHIEALADEVIKGVEASGAIVKPYFIEETLPKEVLEKMYAGSSLSPKYPLVTPDNLKEADGIIIGAPTRYGRVPAQVSAFFDKTGGLWASGALVGKFVTLFTSAAGQHSGHESTAISTFPFFAHHGLVYVPIAYSEPAIGNVEVIQGGSPYGASTVAGSDGSKKPTEADLKIARHQGKFFADFVSTFVRGKTVV